MRKIRSYPRLLASWRSEAIFYLVVSVVDVEGIWEQPGMDECGALEGVGAEAAKESPADIRKDVVSFGGEEVPRNLASESSAFATDDGWVIQELLVKMSRGSDGCDRG
jgi:hypothetical protein